MAHKKAGGSTALGRDSAGRRLGIKLYAGEDAKNGSIVVRQRGTKYHAGKNVKRGNDDTLFATVAGTVSYRRLKRKKFDGSIKLTIYVDVLPKNS